MKLTIGFPTYDDPSGIELSLQDLLMHHDLTDVEIIVIDNHPTVDRRSGRAVESIDTRKLRQSVQAAGATYVPMATPTGTAPPRNMVFEVADGEVVIVADGHCKLAQNFLSAVRQFFSDHPDSLDILTGPLLSRGRHPTGNGVYPMATHYADVWRSHMWGIWSQAWQCTCGQWHFDVSAQLPGNPLQMQNGVIIAAPDPADGTPTCEFFPVAMGRSAVMECPACGQSLPSDLPYSRHSEPLEQLGYRRRCWDPDDTEPFAIPGMGLGLFVCRKDVWPGFPKDMQGFGGGELHMHELFRRNGGRALCHPGLGWWHRFERDYRIPDRKHLPPAEQLWQQLARKTPYENPTWLKVRNYVIWRNHLNMPLDPVHAHFVAPPDAQINEQQWQYLLEDPIGHTDWPAHLKTQATTKGTRPQPPETAETIAAIFDWVITTKRDCIDHLAAIRELSLQCEDVVSLVKRREWDVAALAGHPATYVSHNLEVDPLQDRLQAISRYDLDSRDSLEATPTDCDLLIIDTVHSAERLTAELTRWAPHCRRWIALRGTGKFGETAEGSNKPGLLVAARQFMAANPTWKRIAQSDQQYGLTILSCHPDERTIDRGPGHELHAIFDALGVQMQANCACRARIKQMNAWGAAGCRAHLDEIVEALDQDKDKYSWGTQFKAATKAITSGLAFKINPLNPLRSLVVEAIHRTEADDAAWERRHAA